MRIGSVNQWRVIVAMLSVSCGVALTSMAVVRLRNINRGDTTAVEWALEDLRALPDSSLAPAIDSADYRRAIDRYRDAVRAHRVPVDSIREFYQLYARLARDGRIDSREVRQLGDWLGFPVDGLSAGGEK